MENVLPIDEFWVNIDETGGIELEINHMKIPLDRSQVLELISTLQAASQRMRCQMGKHGIKLIPTSS